MAKIIADYLRRNPGVIFSISDELGATVFYSAMKFLGINPFSLAMNNSKFIAIVRRFNTKDIALNYDWAVKLYNKAQDLGYKVILDAPHNRYTWHMHLIGSNGKFKDLHVQIAKKAWDYLVKLLG